MADFDHAGIGEVADDGDIEFPFVEDGLGHVLLAGFEDHEHALLAFGEHHFVGGHAFFALGDLVHVQHHAHAALAGHLDAGGGEAGGAHILDGDDGVGRHQFQAGFDEEFFGEGVADLDGGALFLAVLVEFSARHGGAVDAVAAGFGADIDHGVAHAGGGGGEDAVGLEDAHGHGIDQRVAVIGGVEIDLAAHGGHAHAIAIAANAADHAIEDAAGAGQAGVAKAQRVEVGDGARPHGEDIAQNAAHAGGGAGIGLDEAGVVVAFHLEDGGQAFTDIDHPGVFAGADQHPGRLGGQGFQPDSGGFVGAMLAPHHREDAEFAQCGGAAEDGQGAGIFIRLEAEFLRQIGGGFGGEGRDAGHGAVVGRRGGVVQSGFGCGGLNRRRF